MNPTLMPDTRLDPITISMGGVTLFTLLLTIGRSKMEFIHGSMGPCAMVLYSLCFGLTSTITGVTRPIGLPLDVVAGNI